MDYTNLKNKTIFDFCKNKRLIKKIIEVSEEEFFAHIRKCLSYNARTLISYAEETGNDELLKAVKEQYREELIAANNEYVMQPDGTHPF